MPTKLTDPQATVLRRVHAGDVLQRGASWSFPLDGCRLHWDMMRRLERLGLIETPDRSGVRTYRLTLKGLKVLAEHRWGSTELA